MNWTELLTSQIEETYATTDNLMAMLEDEDLGWKPPTGDNWMTNGQLLMHLTNACGMCCKGFATGDWGLPAGETLDDMPAEAMMAPAESMPTAASVAALTDGACITAIAGALLWLTAGRALLISIGDPMPTLTRAPAEWSFHRRAI